MRSARWDPTHCAKVQTLPARRRCGLISTIGHDGDRLTPVGATIADHIASQNLASGVLAALFHRERSGAGQRVEVSLLGGQIWAQASEITHYLLTGNVPGRGHFSHPLLRGMYGIFQTADGWIGVIGVPPDARDAFFIAMDDPELALDPRYQGLLASRDDLNELFDRLTPAFRKRTTDEWCAGFRELGVRYAPVRDYAGVVADPQVWENGYLQRVPTADGDRKVVGAPIAMSKTPLTSSADAPVLGEHTEEVLAEIGYSSDQVAALRAGAVI